VIEHEDKPTMIVYSQLDSYPPQVGNGIPVGNWSWSYVNDEHAALGTTWTEQSLEMIGTWDGAIFQLTQTPVPMNRDTPPLGSPTPNCDPSKWMAMVAALDTTKLGIVFSSDDMWDGRCGVRLTAVVRTPELDDALAPFGAAVTVDYELRPFGG